MKDDYFSDYVLESPKQIEKTIIKQELTPPSQLPPAQLPVAPPQIAQNGPLPPGFQMPNVQVPNVQAPPLPNAEGPMNVTAPPIDVQALAEKAKEIKKTLGPVQAQSPINKDMVLPILGGVGGLAALGAIGYGLSKIDNRKSISDRDIRKIEPQLNVSSTPGNIDPVYHEPVFTVGSIGPMPNDVSNSPDYIAHTNLENASNGILTNEDDARLISNSERNKINNTIAKEAGVTPSTSEPEAQTLVATREASLDPVEKTQEKVTFAEPSKEIKEAVIPKSASKIKEVPEGMGLMEGASGPTNWMYNTHKGRYNAIINEFNNGKHPQTMNEAIALNNQYKNKYGGMNRGPVIPNEIAIERGIPAPEPGGRLGKVVSHAGKFGILASIADIANAAQSNKKGDLLETLYEIGKNLTVPTALGLHTGGLNTNEERELAQLRKIGGGRGVAPAGMGQR